MRNNIMTNEMSKRYHELIMKLNDRTKEENRELETLKKIAKMQGVISALDNLNKLENVNILEYDSTPGLFRIQVKISDKYKTIARIKIAKRDTYILIRETTAKELKKNYEIINYNLPAGYHITKDFYNEFKLIADYHIKTQTA